jgi:hypothetical protein
LLASLHGIFCGNWVTHQAFQAFTNIQSPECRTAHVSSIHSAVLPGEGATPNKPQAPAGWVRRRQTFSDFAFCLCWP